jgi:hypothetical protein
MHGVTGFVESAALLVFAAFVLVTICVFRRAKLTPLWSGPFQPDTIRLHL